MSIQLVMALSADGKIARSSHELSLDWTSKEDTQFFVKKTKEAGCMVMGRATFETIGKPLKDRLLLVITRSPEIYTDIPGQVEYLNPATPQEVIERARAAGYQNMVVAGGAHVNSFFLKAGAVDELFLTIEPCLFGSGVGLADDVTLNTKLALVEITPLNEGTITLHYRVIK